MTRLTARTRALLLTLIAALLLPLGLAQPAQAGATVARTGPAFAQAPASLTSISNLQWVRWHTERFDKGDSPAGGWLAGPYAKRLSVYDGFTERNVGPVTFDRDTVTVHDGALDLFGYRHLNADGTWTTMGAGVVPLLGGAYKGFRYGRFSFSINMQPQGDGMSQWWFAGLLWPEPTKDFPAGDHCRGELDWPEAVPGQFARMFNHISGTRATPTSSCSVNPQATCASFPRIESGDPLLPTTGWHRYTIEWLPTGVTYYYDGHFVRKVTCDVPAVPMQLKLQLVSLNKQIPPGEFGHILIDDIEIDKAYYGT